ncbi:MAG: cation:proton antiporter [Armatimonadetes bacterium]|nr:cation:proton antiporter [Armatimonadota bacterium]
MGIAGDIALITVAALIGGMLAHMLRLPVVLGYILAGLAVGPHTPGPTVVKVEEVEVLADLGVALLLFTVGLEFPSERLTPVRKIALLGTPLQIVLTVLFGLGLGSLLEWDWQSSLWFGCLISVSSTMIVLKVLADRGLTDTPAGHIMTAVLIVQDLAIIPMMVLLPALDDLGHGMAALGLALVRSVLFVAAMLVLGGRALPWLMEKMAALGSRELFMLLTLALGLGIGYGTWQMGLSFAFGAFLAGMVLSGSEHRHRALGEVTPLRDLFAMLFFVSVGMLIEPAFIVEDWGVLLFLLVMVMLAKPIIFGFLTWSFGYRDILPLTVALYLGQVGEFAFVLARMGSEDGSLDHPAYLSVLSLTVLTMVLTPFTTRLVEPLYGWWKKRRTRA